MRWIIKRKLAQPLIVVYDVLEPLTICHDRSLKKNSAFFFKEFFHVVFFHVHSAAAAVF